MEKRIKNMSRPGDVGLCTHKKCHNYAKCILYWETEVLTLKRCVALKAHFFPGDYCWRCGKFLARQETKQYAGKTILRGY